MRSAIFQRRSILCPKGDGGAKNTNKPSQESTDKWNKGSYDSKEESLVDHFNRHGEEVGATDADQYVRKAEEFNRNLKGATKSYPDGYTEGAIRYTKNGKYLIKAPDGTFISFGLER